MGPWWRAWLRRYDDSGGPDHVIGTAVALLHHVEHDAGLDALLLARRERLVHVRVEGLALRLDRLHARAPEHALEVHEHELHALGHRVVGGGAGERALE